ncbi:MAG: site-specific DNA-methyltransferase [Candidatus Omnitrophota bacterium]|jgi:DNA modification methylase
MKPYYQDDAVTIYHGVCEEIVPGLGKFDLLLTDPPYGIMRFNKEFGKTRFKRHARLKHVGLWWDVPPDEKWLAYLLTVAPLAIIWGLNNLPLPRSEHFLVWDKEQSVCNFASAELAWCNLSTPAKVFRYNFSKHNANKDGGHPTEKPLALIQWCIFLAGDVKRILDPYAGSGTTGLAAKNLGREAILIESDEQYCEVAARRMRQEVLPLNSGK